MAERKDYNGKSNSIWEEQISELLEQLTLEEKISMIHGNGLFCTKAVERLGIPELVMSDGPMGVRNQFPNASWIPVGTSDDYVSYLASNSALAATWNPHLAYESGKILGTEARGRGKDVILAPGINIKRDPLCGRNFEYMSEDPYLIETLAVPFIKGVQENDVAACVKHFAANNQENNRLWVDSVVDERTLQEIYFPGFKAAIHEGDCYSVMNAYNKLNGVLCSENKDLLDDVLRMDWEYDGVVISDWGAVRSTKEAAEASTDLEMSVTFNFDEYCFANPLLEAVQKGEVDEACVDAKVRNILRMMFRLKMLGEEACDRKSGSYNDPAHQQGIRKVAEESIVLLKNEEGLLPFSQKSFQPKKKIAVIGRNAEHCHAGGGGSAEIKALYEISPLLGLKQALGGNVEVTYAPGYFIPGKKDVNEVNWQEASLERRVMGEEDPDSEEQKALRKEIEEGRERLKQEACAIAREADEVIFVGGLNHDYDVEGRDRADMCLPYGQDELIEELLAIQPNMVIVMVAGSPVEMPWISKAKAVLWVYYAGMETGRALADILLGKVNPSGKLPETFPVAYQDTVTAKNGQFGPEDTLRYEEGIFVGYRYYEKEQVIPAFPFGFGLSYTKFVMENMQTEVNDGCVTISVEIENAGDRAGAEVVQCYVTDCECSVERPVKELKAYTKVFLEPGEKKTVTMELSPKAFAFYDAEEMEFVVEPGTFTLWVGNAVDNCLLSAEIEIDA